MDHLNSPRRQVRLGSPDLLLLPLLLSLTMALAGARPGGAQEPLAAPRAAQIAAPVTLMLGDCLQVALQRHPRITAQRASLAATEDSNRALDALRVPPFLDRELPIRRRQAALGLTAATAGVELAERETAYAVTRTYFTVVYARAQERVARSVVARLTALRDTAKQQLDEGAKGVTSSDVSRTTVYLRLAEVKRIEAEQGAKRALVALRQAMGLGPGVCIDVEAGPLPEPEARPCCADVVAWAVARSGQLVRAGVFAEVTCLEIDAQASTPHKPRLETFAAGSDIHATQVPQDVHNNEYRPGGIPPEMPTMLAGPRPERVKHAQSLYARAGAVVEDTRHLIVLEAEDAFLRWQEAARQVPQARDAADTGDQMAQDLDKDYAARSNVKIEEVMTARVLASQARSQYHESLYKQILALADLERITGGAFCAGLTRPAARQDNQTR